MAEIRVMRQRRFGDGRPEFRIGNMFGQRAAHQRKRSCFILGFRSRDKRGRVPGGCSLRIGKSVRAFRVPCDVADGLQQCGEMGFGRGCAFGQGKPVRRRGIGMRHALFEPIVARLERMDHRFLRIETCMFETRHFACDARGVIVDDGRIEARKRASALCVGGRVCKIDQDFAVALFDRIGADGIAAHECGALREIEFPIVPVAGEYAAGPNVPSLSG
jgi:hypothetical protein